MTETTETPLDRLRTYLEDRAVELRENIQESASRLEEVQDALAVLHDDGDVPGVTPPVGDEPAPVPPAPMRNPGVWRERACALARLLAAGPLSWGDLRACLGDLPDRTFSDAVAQNTLSRFGPEITPSDAWFAKDDGTWSLTELGRAELLAGEVPTEPAADEETTRVLPGLDAVHSNGQAVE